MSNKVFITKFPSKVDNDSLPMIGDLTFTIKDRGDGLVNGFSIFIDATDGKMASRPYSIKADKPFALSKDGDKITETSGMGTKYLNIQVFEETKFTVNSKYFITFIHDRNDFSSNAACSFDIDINDFKYSYYLKSLMLGKNNDEAYLPTSVTGDISSLSNLTAMTELDLPNTSVTGDISSLSNLTAMTKLNLSNTSVTGDISSIIEKMTKLTVLYIPSTIKITDEQKQTLTDRGCTVTIM